DAHALREVGQGIERGFGGAGAIDELAKGLRPDIGRADEPKPGDLLRRTEVVARRAAHQEGSAVFPAPIFGSVPAISRAMFELWRTMRRSERSATTSANVRP